MQNKPTPEEIIQKLAEKKYQSDATGGRMDSNFINEQRRIGYKQALRDVLPLIDGWVSVEEQEPPELVDLQVFIPKQDHIASAIYEKKEGFYESYNNETIDDPVSHWKLTGLKPGTSSLQKLLE